jgi:diguanylate cyclase (GGDEF)-like protein
MRQVVMANEGVQPDAIAAYKLKCSGLIELDGNLAKPSCELYRLYFQTQLEAHYGTGDRLQPLELKLEQQEPQPLPHIANLTQLADRHFFKECLDSGWQQWMRETTLVSLMICEIDYFKFFNDAYGATTGDACLQEIAITIQDCINYQATLLARYGSAEFALIFSQVDIGTVADFAETIRKRIKALGIVHDQSRVSGFPAQVITASVGVATTVPNPKISPTDLITEAEKALYQAKRQGRDRVNQIHLVGSED